MKTVALETQLVGETLLTVMKDSSSPSRTRLLPGCEPWYVVLCCVLWNMSFLAQNDNTGVFFVLVVAVFFQEQLRIFWEPSDWSEFELHLMTCHFVEGLYDVYVQYVCTIYVACFLTIS